MSNGAHPPLSGILHLDGLPRDSYRSRYRAMSTEVKKEIQLEIAHVLFIDIVGYSNCEEMRARIAARAAPDPGFTAARADFDSLRDDPRFQKLVTSPVPKWNRQTPSHFRWAM
jgi:hypothetical protein